MTSTPHTNGQPPGAPGDLAWFAPVALVALSAVLGMQLLRLTFPFVQYLLYERLRVPPALAALAAGALFAAGGAMPALVRAVGLRRTLLGSGAAVAVSRLAIQLWPGDPAVALLLAFAGVAAFFVLLPAMVAVERARAASAPGSGHRFAVALLLGLGADAALRVLGETYDAAWRGGAAPAALALALAAAHGIALRRVARRAPDDRVPAATAFPWGTLGCLLYLELAVFGNSPRLAVLSAWGFPAVAAAVVGGQALGALAATWAASVPAWALACAAAALAGSLVPGAEGSGAAVAVAAGHGALGLLFARAAAGGEAVPLERRAHARTGLVLAGLVGLHYARQGVAVPFRADWAHLVPAVAVAVVALTAPALVAPRLPRAALAAAALTLFLAPLAVRIGWSDPVAVAAPAGRPVRLVSYNVHKGFSTTGTLDLEGIARTIEAQRPDVVALQEVSRGQVIDGTVDMALVLSRRLRMPFVYAPAGAGLWGQAVLTSFPIVRTAEGLLPPLAIPTPRGYALVELDTGVGPLRVVDTHYSPSFGAGARLEHTRALVDLIARDGLSRTVVAGDLNAAPSEPSVTGLLGAGLVDSAAEGGTAAGLTVPSWRPVARIDYVLHSPDLTASDVTTAGGDASDHLLVAVTLRPRVPPAEPEPSAVP